MKYLTTVEHSRDIEARLILNWKSSNLLTWNPMILTEFTTWLWLVQCARRSSNTRTTAQSTSRPITWDGPNGSCSSVQTASDHLTTREQWTVIARRSTWASELCVPSVRSLSRDWTFMLEWFTRICQSGHVQVIHRSSFSLYPHKLFRLWKEV